MKLLLIETSRLRDEVERLRAVEQEARYLSASVDQIMKSRDHWRREAERARALIAQVTPWSLLCWRFGPVERLRRRLREGAFFERREYGSPRAGARDRPALP
jgi:hypothetical protein